MCLSINSEVRLLRATSSCDMSNSVVIPPYFFCNFSIIPYVFINSHRYLKLIICMLNHWVKGLYLGISLVPCLVIQGNW